MNNNVKTMNTKLMAVIYSALFAAGILFISGGPLQAQEKSCNTACDLYYDCFSIAYKQTKEGKTAAGLTKLKNEKQNIIKKCVRECNAKKNEGNILQCYKTRTPTLPVCQAFYGCAVKFYKTDN